MKPLFGARDLPSDLPLFAWGPFRDPGAPGTAAQVRGRLWRFPSGEIALALDPKGPWIEGEIVPPLDPGRARVLAALAGAGARDLAPRVTRARVGVRAVAVVTWAGDARRLRTMGALPLRLRDPDRAR
ncbi:MAG: hypothetical protein JXB39_01630 [Deltaproteobacteria bacterium]|nr:hypothetical protein [Deltaproteobacteria bacterium]